MNLFEYLSIVLLSIKEGWIEEGRYGDNNKRGNRVE